MSYPLEELTNNSYHYERDLRWLKIASPGIFKDRAEKHIYELRTFTKRRQERLNQDKAYVPQITKQTGKE